MRNPRGRFGGGIALLLLSGCGSSGQSDYPQYFTILKQSVSSAFRPSSITMQQAAAIPYASMGWRLNNGSQNIIVLASDSSQELMWTSAARIVLVTQDGRIKRTVGLPRDLAGLVPRLGSRPSAPGKAAQGPFTTQYLADFPDMQIYGAQITCRSQSMGKRAITILQRKISVMRIEEDCQGPSMRWSFKNIYWVDPQTSFVWRSQQNIHPRGDFLTTEIFRPPE